jgi:hypothetical protein
MKELRWLLTDKEMISYTNDYEWDVVLNTFWENGVICPSDAYNMIEHSRFEDYCYPRCPHCFERDQHYECKERGPGEYRCKCCNRRFSLTSKTYLDNTKLELYMWWRFAWLVSEMKMVNSNQIARDIGVTQKTAWMMLETLRSAKKETSDHKLVNGSNSIDFKNYYEVLNLLLSFKKPIVVSKKESRSSIRPVSNDFRPNYYNNNNEMKSKKHAIRNPLWVIVLGMSEKGAEAIAHSRSAMQAIDKNPWISGDGKSRQRMEDYYAKWKRKQKLSNVQSEPNEIERMLLDGHRQREQNVTKEYAEKIIGL